MAKVTLALQCIYWQNICTHSEAYGMCTRCSLSFCLLLTYHNIRANPYQYYLDFFFEQLSNHSEMILKVIDQLYLYQTILS